MAPEILKEEEYNGACDLWSLGIIIYQLCFKEYPYQSTTEYGLLNKIIENGQKLFKKMQDENLNLSSTFSVKNCFLSSDLILSLLIIFKALNSLVFFILALNTEPNAPSPILSKISNLFLNSTSFFS